jgi:hypothetical protein
MSPGGEVANPELVQNDWKIAALCAANMAEKMGEHGVHKSLCNRLLMPFTHANVIVTATDYDNFFGLRLAEDVDPTMRALAVAMWEARVASQPIPLTLGRWHLPFADNALDTFLEASGHLPGHKILDLRIKVSVARCARVSYESFETGKRSTIEADLALYDRLLAQAHWSAFEHQATPDWPLFHDLPNEGQWRHWYQCGNLRPGWRQYRKMLSGENIKPMPKDYV